MKRLHHGLLAIVLIGGTALAGFWWFSVRQDAHASSSTPTDAVMDDVTATVTTVESENSPEDPRLQGLIARADGARLFWSSAPNEAILEAGFADILTIVVSSTTTDGYRIAARNFGSRTASQEMKSKTPQVASSSRQMQRNADRFCDTEPNERGALDVWCYNAAWKNPKRLTMHDGQEDLIEPALSPDGNWVVLEVNTDRMRKGPTTPKSTIWRIGLGGTNLQQLTRGADDRNPTWSEDGSHIYFQRRMPDTNWDMYAMGADGSGLSPLLRTFDEDERWVNHLIGQDAVIVAVSQQGSSSRVRKIDLTTKAGEWLTDGTGGSETHVSVSPDGKLFSFIAPIDPADPTRLGVWVKEIAP